MKEFLSVYVNPNEDRINLGLINREYDDDLVDLVAGSCKSLEVCDHIKFLGYTVVDDEKDIDLNDYMTTRKTTKKKDDTRYMYTHDSRYIEMRLKFRLECKDDAAIINKKLLIPIADDTGYYTIKGNKYIMLYQLVDSSTYTTRQNLTLKSLMPVIVKRVKAEHKDTDGVPYVAPAYLVFIFKKEVDILLFYFAKMGVTKTLKFFSVDQVIHFVEDESDDKDKFIYFKIKSKMFLKINRYFFLKYQYVQTIAFMILQFVTNRLRFEDLDNKDYWVEWIGSLTTTGVYNYQEKGMNTIRFFNRMLDENTKRILKVDKTNKKTMYSGIRWMIQNYNELRKKDNMDLANKRLRCNEYIVSLLTKAFNERLNRVISAGRDVNLDKVKEVFKFPGSLLMEQLHRSGLLRYDDRINDMDMFGKLRFTLKGPSTQGNKNDNKISTVYRGIDPSMLGRLDINVCGTTDPGSSGIITPFCKTEGMYFDGAGEPEHGIFEFDRENRQYTEELYPEMLNIDLYKDCENVQEVLNLRNEFTNNNNQVKANRTIRENGMLNIWLDSDQGDEEL